MSSVVVAVQSCSTRIPARRGVQREEKANGIQIVPQINLRAEDLSPESRERIFKVATDFFLNPCGEISKLVAKYFGGLYTEQLIDEVIVGVALQRQAEAANFRNNLKNLDGIAREAGESIWERA